MSPHLDIVKQNIQKLRSSGLLSNGAAKSFLRLARSLTKIGRNISHCARPSAVQTTRQRKDENLVAMILSAISNQRTDVKGISRASLVKQ